jgi:uncharacterized membrane protein YjjP (DUF1212 family)
MAYGAPSHRIEEYTLQLFKVLDIEGRCNYTVGCTDISFINPVDPLDPMSRTAYTTIVKAQGLDIGACEIAFRIYKDVIHGEYTVEEATEKLLQLIDSPSFYRPWQIVPFYGVASAFACVWAYGGYWTDMSISFVLGCIVGFLQVIVAAANPLYSNVLEVTAALITSFLARAFASIGECYPFSSRYNMNSYRIICCGTARCRLIGPTSSGARESIDVLLLQTQRCQ